MSYYKLGNKRETPLFMDLAQLYGREPDHEADVRCTARIRWRFRTIIMPGDYLSYCLKIPIFEDVVAAYVPMISTFRDTARSNERYVKVVWGAYMRVAGVLQEFVKEHEPPPQLHDWKQLCLISQDTHETVRANTIRQALQEHRDGVFGAKFCYEAIQAAKQ